MPSANCHADWLIPAVKMGLWPATAPGFLGTWFDFAVYGPEGQSSPFRYVLGQESRGRDGWANFLMLNPSTATHLQMDATVRRCARFAAEWGRNWVVTNLYAFRSTDPKALKTTSDPVGPLNDKIIRMVAEQCDLTICAWGANGTERGKDVIESLVSRIGFGPKLHHLGPRNNDGSPKHPLYLSKSEMPRPLWENHQ